MNMGNKNKMSDYKKLENKIIDLESKLAFQEHTIQELNDVVTQQQTELMNFKTHLKRLSEHLENQPSSTSSSGEDASLEPPPPHY